MIVDTSALMAIILGEPEGAGFLDILAQTNPTRMSAATVAEFLIVAARRDRLAEAKALLTGLAVETVSVMHADAVRAAEAYRLWGRGFHVASLNFGDCFAYATAKSFDEPLLFVGKDFAQTDVASAGPPPRTSTS